jgi:hypothetical protein
MQGSSEVTLILCGSVALISLIVLQVAMFARLQSPLGVQTDSYLELAKKGASAYQQVFWRSIATTRVVGARALAKLPKWIMRRAVEPQKVMNIEEVARKDVYLRDFAIVLLNISLVLILGYGILLWVRQTTPETQIANRDLVLILSFSIGCLLSVCLTYEFQIGALRARHYRLLTLLRRRRRSASIAGDSTSAEIGQSSDWPTLAGQQPRKADEGLWPIDIDQRVESMADDPEAARQFLIDAGIYDETGQVLADLHRN